MPFKTSMDPTQIPEGQPTNLAPENSNLSSSNPAIPISEPNGSRISAKWFLGIMITVVIILLAAILGFGFHELNSHGGRIGTLEVQNAVVKQKIESNYTLIDERTKGLGKKLDNLHTLIREGK